MLNADKTEVFVFGTITDAIWTSKKLVGKNANADPPVAVIRMAAATIRVVGNRP